MKEIKIGNQIWNTKNLALTVDRNGRKLKYGKDYFYPGGIKSLVDKYGLLYTWNAAMRVCPKGWHLPTTDEFDELIKRLHISEFASTNEWPNGDLPTKQNAIFNALPVGEYDDDDYIGLGYKTYFWSSTEYDFDEAYYYHLYQYQTNVDKYYHDKRCAYSVRCIKNTNQFDIKTFEIVSHKILLREKIRND